MLIIREEQFAAFDAESERIFETRLIRHLASLFPERLTGASEQRLRASVRKRIAQAEKYGIDEESDCAVYVVLSILRVRFKTQDDGLQVNARTDPWAKGIFRKDIFAAESTSGHMKMAIIEDLIAEDAALDARSRQACELIEKTRGQF